MTEPRKIRIGISSCLLGAEVRFDGGHKRDRYINEVLGQYFEFCPVCPEVDSGMGVPRQPIRLVQHDDGALRAVGVKDPGFDATEGLSGFSRSRMPGLAGLRGYLVKAKSPSCGMERVRIYAGKEQPKYNGRGLFTSVLIETYPLLPVEEEGRLCDPALRENFLERVLVYDRWLGMLESGPTVAGLIDFHSGIKLLVMSHNQAACRRLGRMVAGASAKNLTETAEAYGAELMHALKRPASQANHVNALQHIMGYLKRDLDRADKQEFQEVLESYRQGRLPLIVPLTLIRHFFRRFPKPYIGRQVYLDWHWYLHEYLLRHRL